MFTKEMFLNPFIELWNGIVAVLPKLIVAIIVFIIGWLVAKVVYKAIVKLGKKIKIDEAVKPMAGAVEKAGYSLKIGKTIAFLVKWFIVIGTLVVSLDLLGLQTTKGLLTGIIAYIPQVIIAIFVLMAGVALANFTKKIIKGSTSVLNVKSAGFLANLARITLIIFTVLISLNVIGFNSEIINILFMGAVAMVALAGGLSFGLGGRDAAAEVIREVKSSMHK
jgi:hypothetical protein